MAAKVVTVGERTYISVRDDFGTVVRPTFLGLQSAPVVQLDDGTFAGFAGQHALKEVVPVADGKNLDNETVAVPLDVRTVGTQVMNLIGVPSETQAAMFQTFRALDKAQRDELVSQWQSANAGTDQDKAAFVQAMVSQLT